MAAAVIIAPTGTVDPRSTVRLSWSYGTQTHYRVRYKKREDTVWIDTGKVASSNKYHDIPPNTLQKNAQYEWKVMVWNGQTQEPWSAKEGFVSQVPTTGIVQARAGGSVVQLRTVPLGASEIASKLRTRIAGQTVEFDLTAQPVADSKVRVRQDGVTRNIAKPVPDWYSNYGNHTNTGYEAYSNHYNSGYSKYSNHSDYGYSRYSDHSDINCYYQNHSNHYYSRYRDTETYSAYYYNHTDAGYGAYPNHSNSGYKAHSNHTNSGYSAHKNHSNSGYKIHSDHNNTN